MTNTEPTDFDPRRIEPPHEIIDDIKVAGLSQSMCSNGWQGAPVVVIVRADGDPLAITGSHRIAAASLAGINVPTVDLGALFAEHGADLPQLVAALVATGMSEDGAMCEAAVRAAGFLPAGVVRHYGLDLH